MHVFPTEVWLQCSLNWYVYVATAISVKHAATKVENNTQRW